MYNLKCNTQISESAVKGKSNENDIFRGKGKIERGMNTNILYLMFVKELYSAILLGPVWTKVGRRAKG